MFAAWPWGPWPFMSLIAIWIVNGCGNSLLEPSTNARILYPSFGNAPIATSLRRIGRTTSRSMSLTLSIARVSVTFSSRISRACVYFLTSGSLSLRKSMRPIRSDSTTPCTSLTSCPGVAESANSRNDVPRRQSCSTT